MPQIRRKYGYGGETPDLSRQERGEEKRMGDYITCICGSQEWQIGGGVIECLKCKRRYRLSLYAHEFDDLKSHLLIDEVTPKKED